MLQKSMLVYQPVVERIVDDDTAVCRAATGVVCIVHVALRCVVGGLGFCL